ncbi:tyrosinase [Ceratobasidium sp. AG-Ba]|nr:tyrosinase [Ceratobasidium sp. AG-Ba]
MRPFTLSTSAIALTLFSVIAGAQPERRQTTSNECTKPAVRKEWRDLDATTQQNYIAAVKCLRTKPSTVNLNEGATLYDDFTTVHLRLASQIHFVAQFLPWHRWFVHLYETALQDCGYNGNAVYWDWTRDAGPNVVNSPIFDPVTGFGGTGRNISERSPVATGPFVNFTVLVHSGYWEWQGKSYNQPHYLERKHVLFLSP